MITVSFMTPEGALYVLDLPAVPPVGDTVIFDRTERKVVRVVWKPMAGKNFDRITVHLGERR